MPLVSPEVAGGNLYPAQSRCPHAGQEGRRFMVNVFQSISSPSKISSRFSSVTPTPVRNFIVSMAWMQAATPGVTPTTGKVAFDCDLPLRPGAKLVVEGSYT